MTLDPSGLLEQLGGVRSIILASILSAPIFFLSSGLCRAELPPQVYIELQSKAGEILKIHADEVISKPKGLLDKSSYTETVKATVVEVIRSASGVRKGDVITIVYQRLVPEEGMAGPSPAPQLKQGQEYSAYLGKGEDGNFSLAARGMSFTKMK